MGADRHQVNDAPEINEWFDSMRRDFRRWYLASDNPWRQSGWGSTPERWRLAREVILSAVEHGGAFLDIGCANGLLLECLIAWANERGVVIEPHGIDLVPELVDLARQRLPEYASNFILQTHSRGYHRAATTMFICCWSRRRHRAIASISAGSSTRQSRAGDD